MIQEQDRIYKVYKHTLPIAISGKENDMVYIGITRKKNVEQRWLNGRGYQYNMHFSRAIKKYSWDGFLHEVLLDGLTKEEAEQKEIEFIALYDSTDPNKGYNASFGGSTAGKTLERTKQLISQKNKGRHHSEEAREKISKAHFGKKKSQEFCDNLSDIKSVPVICIETKITYKSASEAGKLLGIDHSTISKCCRGENKEAGGFHWMFAEEYNEEKANELLEKTRNEQHRRVMCVDTGKVYNTVLEAANDVGTSGSNISFCCRGKSSSAAGYRWLYLEDATEENINKLLNTPILKSKPQPVYCIELDVVFENAKEAGKYVGVAGSNVTAVCKGRNQSAGKLPDGTKLHWMYYEDYLKQQEQQEQQDQQAS